VQDRLDRTKAAERTKGSHGVLSWGPPRYRPVCLEKGAEIHGIGGAECSLGHLALVQMKPGMGKRR
jgi:hypothetical protein